MAGEETLNLTDIGIQQQILLADHGLDRQGHRRSQTDDISLLKSASDTRYLLMQESAFACDDKGVFLLSIDDIHALHLDMSAALFIGLQPAICDGSIFAIKANSDQLLSQLKWVTLRELAVKVSRPMANLLATAQALLIWHDNHRYCSRCGHVTDLTLAGHGRRCGDSACACDVYPRIDPAIIVLVTNNDQCLLARGSTWSEKRFSCLAGFVEVGESIEDAVKREVYEEVGLRLDEVRYQASQPWPFPQSLMLGFYAVTREHALTFHDGEIAEAHWYNAGQLEETIRHGELLISSSLSISFQLLDHWYLQQTGDRLVHLLSSLSP